LLALALISLQIVLNRGEIDDWFGSPLIRNLAAISACAAALFLLWQFSPRNCAPLLDLALIRDRRVMAAILIGVFTGMLLSGSLYVLPEFLRSVSEHTYSATQTGRIICVYALTAAAVRPIVVPLIAHIGQRKTIVLALIMLIASMLLLQHYLTTETAAEYYIAPLVLYGLCLSPLLPAVGSGTIAQIAQDKLLDAVSLYMTFRQFGSSLGVALLTILLSHRETLHSARLFEHLRGNNGSTLASLASRSANAVAHGYSSIDAQGLALAQLAEAGRRQAATLSYADAFGFMAVIGIIALCLIPIMPPTPVIRK
jgi:DHA2 family multidrug resistance protein